MAAANRRERCLEQVFRIKVDIDHLVGDLKDDAWLPEDSEIRKYPHRGSNSLFSWPKRIEGLDGAVFDCDGERIQISDFPSVKEDWPIMSRKMLDILLSVGDFPHQAIPVVMSNVFDNPPIEAFHNFVAVQLLEHLNIFDWENSVYETVEDRPDIVEPNSIEDLVLVEPEGGFPPLFRVKQIRTRLFISSAAKQALEAADIQGIDYRNKDGRVLYL